MKKIILTIGITGSGKDLWVEDYQSNSDKNIMVINRDEMRCKYFTETNSIDEYEFNVEKEKATKVLSEYQVLTSVADEVIISDTNLSKSTRNRWKSICTKHNFEYQEVLFHTNLLDALAANLNREFPLPELVIANQFVSFNKYVEEIERINLKAFEETKQDESDGADFQ